MKSGNPESDTENKKQTYIILFGPGKTLTIWKHKKIILCDRGPLIVKLKLDPVTLLLKVDIVKFCLESRMERQ